MIGLLVRFFFDLVLRAELLQRNVYFAREEAEGGPQLVNEDSHLLQHVTVASDFRLEHLDLVVPLEHLILLIGDL